MWADLSYDIVKTFRALEGVFDLNTDDYLSTTKTLPPGYHAHEHLNTSKLTTHEFLTPFQRASSKTVENIGRRAAKTAWEYRRGEDARSRKTERITRARELRSAGLSKAAVGRELGVTAETVARWLERRE